MMSGWDAYLRLNTPKLHVPTEFIPTRPHDRGWLIPFVGKNSLWTIPIAIFPALIATALIFMDQQITAVIINRKEFKLKVRIDCLAPSNGNGAGRLEKSRLSSGLVGSVVFHSHSIATWSAVVCRGHRSRTDPCQFIEDHEWKLGTRRETEVSRPPVGTSPREW